MDDDDIREALRRGDRQRALDLLSRRYAKTVFNRCRSVLHDDNAAEDAMQQTLMEAVRNDAELLKVTNFKAWLRVVATRKSYDVSRKGSRRREEALTDDEAQSADAVLAATLDRRALKICLGRLSHDLRVAVLLWYVEGCSWAEIGKVLRTDPDNIRMKVQRSAMPSLRKCMAGKEVRS